MILIKKLFLSVFAVRIKTRIIKDRITGIKINKLVRWESMIPARPQDISGTANLFLVADRLIPCNRMGIKMNTKAIPVAADTKVITNR